jgi:hypothetical protein
MQNKFINILSSFHRSLNILVPTKYNWILKNITDDNKKSYLVLLEKLLSSLDEIDVNLLEKSHQILFVKLEQNAQFNLQINLSFELRFLNPAAYLPFIPLTKAMFFATGDKQQEYQKIIETYLNYSTSIANLFSLNSYKTDVIFTRHTIDILTLFLKTKTNEKNIIVDKHYQKIIQPIASYKDTLQKKIIQNSKKHSDLFNIIKNKTIKADCAIKNSPKITRQQVDITKIKKQQVCKDKIMNYLQEYKNHKLLKDINIHTKAIKIYKNQISALLQPIYANIQLTFNNIQINNHEDDLINSEIASIFILALMFKEKITKNDYHQNLLPVVSLAAFLAYVLKKQDFLTLISHNLYCDTPICADNYPIHQAPGESSAQFIIYQRLKKLYKKNNSYDSVLAFCQNFYQRREEEFLAIMDI